MIVCKICGKSFKMITNTHLKSHSMSAAEYQEKFPGALLVSSETSQLYSSNAKRLNQDRDYSDLGKKISETKKNNQTPAHNKGKPCSDEQKLKLSAAMRGKRARQGAILSAETKSKISESLKQRANLPEKIQEREQRKAKRELNLQARKLEYVESFKQNANSVGLDLLEIDLDKKIVSLKCQTCGHEFSRTKQSVESSKVQKTKCRVCHPMATTSAAQLEISKFISDLGVRVVNEDRVVLGGKEIDIYLPDYSLGFEFNGLYWHSELNHGIPKHLLWKQQFAHNVGVRLIHIFEDEWRDKQEIVKSRIRYLLKMSSNRIFARDCTVEKISSRQKDEFLIENHLQGKDVSGVRYGLFNRGELVSVMTFKPASYVKGHRDGWELNRFASKNNLSVVGGASKLFKAFLKEHDPALITSFADRRWNTGNLYSSLGFNFSHCSSPSYWYLEKYAKRLHRGQFMKHTLVKTEDDRLLTEWELMQAKGYDRIWDCGTVVYQWKN